MKKELIKKLIVEALQKPLKKSCSCGCGTCSTNDAPILTESKVKNILSEGLQHHIDNKIPLYDTIYRYSSDKHLSLIKEAKKLYSRGIIDLAEGDKQLIETHLGEFGMFEGEVVPLDLPMMNEGDWPASKATQDRKDMGYDLNDLLAVKSDLKKKGFEVKVGYPTEIDPKIQIQHIDGDIDDLQLTLNQMFGDNYRIVFDTNQRMFEAYRTGTYAGRKVILHMDGKETDWEVEFENGKRVSYADAIANLKLDESLDENLDKVAGGIPYKIENDQAIISMPLPDDVKERIIKRAKENGYSAKPNMSGGVTIFKESNLNEYSEYGGREVKLNKPKRGGSKAYYVYVKDPRTKKVKKVQFGSGGLRAKIKDKDKRLAFAARHKCSTKKDRTKPGYWSCNLPRYAKALKLGNNMNTYW